MAEFECRSVSRVAPEDPQQLLAVAEQPPEPDLVLGLAQEVLLARRAHEVGVGVAEAHVVQRLRAAELLVAGADVDLGVLRADAAGRGWSGSSAGRRRRRRSRGG